jgi:hypothetical protein
MPLRWLVLVAIVRLIFVLAPRTVKQSEFNLAPPQWAEAQEMARVGTCRGLLASLPVILSMSTFQATEKACPTGIAAFPTVSLSIVLVVVVLGLLRFPARWLRGTLVPYALIAGLLVLDAAFQWQLLAPSAASLCADAPQKN